MYVGLGNLGKWYKMPRHDEIDRPRASEHNLHDNPQWMSSWRSRIEISTVGIIRTNIRAHKNKNKRKSHVWLVISILNRHAAFTSYEKIVNDLCLKNWKMINDLCHNFMLQNRSPEGHKLDSDIPHSSSPLFFPGFLVIYL